MNTKSDLSKDKMIGQLLPMCAECTKLCNDRVYSGHATVLLPLKHIRNPSPTRPPATQSKRQSSILTTRNSQGPGFLIVGNPIQIYRRSARRCRHKELLKPDWSQEQLQLLRWAVLEISRRRNLRQPGLSAMRELPASLAQGNKEDINEYNFRSA